MEKLDRGYPQDWPYGNPHDRMDKVFAVFLLWFALSIGFVSYLQNWIYKL